MNAADVRLKIEQIFNQVFNQHQLELVDEIYAESFMVTDPSNGLKDHPGDRDMIRNMVQMYRDAFSDLEYSVHDITVEDGKGMCSWTFTGTFDGELMNVKPNNECIEMDGCSRVTFDADDKVNSIWQLWDARKVQELMARASAAQGLQVSEVPVAVASADFNPAAHAMREQPFTGKGIA